MISRQLQTSPTNPQINFYRTIAVSFFVITVLLLIFTIFFTSKKAEITIIAKEDPKNVNFNIDVEREKQSATSLSGVVTSTDFYWEEKYFPTTSKDKAGVATGEVIIYNKMNTAQPLVKTTRLLTSEKILFRLSEGVTVPANGQITAKIYSDAPGPIGEIEPSQLTIPGLSESKQQMVYAENTKPTTGGSVKVGVLTQEDLTLAMTNYKEAVKKAFADEFNSENKYYNNKIITIDRQNSNANHKLGDEISEFKINGTSHITVVMFNKEDLADLIEKEVGKKIDLTEEKILAIRKDPTASLISVDVSGNKAQISVNQEISVTLDSNAERLAPQNFAGKDRDEIERYIMGLSHANGVEIKFSPSWMQTSPSSVDKIRVVIKNMQ